MMTPDPSSTSMPPAWVILALSLAEFAIGWLVGVAHGRRAERKRLAQHLRPNEVQAFIEYMDVKREQNPYLSDDEIWRGKSKDKRERKH